MINSYRVYSYDAFVAPSERSEMLRGEFDTKELAENFAKQLIDDEIAKDISKGRTMQQAVDAYKHAGEIPMVFGEPKSEFSAYEYLNSLPNQDGVPTA